MAILPVTGLALTGGVFLCISSRCLCGGAAWLVLRRRRDTMDACMLRVSPARGRRGEKKRKRRRRAEEGRLSGTEGGAGVALSNAGARMNLFVRYRRAHAEAAFMIKRPGVLRSVAVGWWLTRHSVVACSTCLVPLNLSTDGSWRLVNDAGGASCSWRQRSVVIWQRGRIA